ncbi:MAG: hypothetical protein IKD23_07170 [Lentisphaeria bacterium]|nr:hypothetical protein [Lentisphaeria bacterium]
MKTFNIIACILILLLAIVSAVFSYFLYEKRVQFVDGWTQMSTAIQTSAKKIDEQSDKKAAPELTVEKLSHKVYTEEGLRRQLSFLTNQSKEFVDKFNNAMTGWEIMTKAIYDSVSTLDSHTDGKYSNKVTKEELVFDNPKFNADEFSAKIKNLLDQSKEVTNHYQNARESWDMMSELIHGAAVIIDKHTGKNQAGTLEPGVLSKYNNKFNKNIFQEQISNLTTQLNIFVKYYTNAEESWKIMSKAIYDSALTIDAHTGKKQAGSLDPAKLAKYNTDKFNKNTFQNQINNLTTQLNIFVKYYTNAEESWKIMSKAIYDSSVMIDIKTGKKQASELDPKKLDMYNTDRFKKEVFEKQIAKLTTQVAEFTLLYENTVKGWKQMQNAIIKASTNMDHISSQKYAAGFRQANFDNMRYNDAEFNRMITRLVTQSEDAVKRYDATVKNLNDTRAELKATKDELSATKDELARRMGQLNAIAQTMTAIGTKVSTNGITKDGFVDLRRYSGQMNAVNSRVVQIVNNRAYIVAQLKKLVTDHKGKLDDTKLFAAANESAVRTALSPVYTIFNTQKNSRISYAKAISDIAGQLGIPFKDDIYSNATATAGIVEANRKKLKVDIPSLQTQLANAHLDIANKQEIINTRDKTIADQKVVISDFQQIFNLVEAGGDKFPKPWERGSDEARSAIVGSVVRVSPEFGYIIVNIGSETVVVQKIGSKEYPVNPEVEDGLTFHVVRDGEFIAEIKLNEVDKNESTADIPPSKAGAIKVGDKVIYQKK